MIREEEQAKDNVEGGEREVRDCERLGAIGQRLGRRTWTFGAHPAGDRTARRVRIWIGTGDRGPLARAPRLQTHLLTSIDMLTSTTSLKVPLASCSSVSPSGRYGK